MSTKPDLLDHIDHQAIVEKVDKAASTVTVRLTGDDGEDCGQCPAAALCGAKGKDSLEITTPQAASFSPGDHVIITGTEQMHRKAIMLATVIPCIALVVVMVGVYLLTLNQLLAALCGLGATLLFYLLIYLAKDKIAHEFNFTIRHI